MDAAQIIIIRCVRQLENQEDSLCVCVCCVRVQSVQSTRELDGQVRIDAPAGVDVI